MVRKPCRGRGPTFSLLTRAERVYTPTACLSLSEERRGGVEGGRGEKKDSVIGRSQDHCILAVRGVSDVG